MTLQANQTMEQKMPEAQIMKASSPSLTKPTFGYPSFRIPFLNDADMEIFTVFVLIMVLAPDSNKLNCVIHNHPDIEPLLRALHEHRGRIKLIFE
ncbi:uncharacterized protein BO96DRAFT_342380 [Aspergillus niger CBS 101883]|uniref:Uncharacterized protein n=1 Tax=Aspergillus niger ATCC 13496 TaxID=1353008 RepID=A0A370BF18_ASPNG|nr:uncharacterized protein BO96DRAFT_342380 [Aspergillus niger CBS 101883]PYH54777.1 hypothetical protein BO96DRAFT_342380 [Aspergillus niger CBS 101883]RDH14056.1 hypothetical protein M747DRAFT_250345 [Aspergillus niger ATCC 13496]